MSNRRSIYALNKNLPIGGDALEKILEQVVLETPSSFNSQSTRLVLLQGTHHEQLWQIVEGALKKIVPAENFAATAQRLAGFRAGAGTVLFFEDENVIKGLQEKMPLYAANFPIWAEHANAMHQLALWEALAAQQVGANLQHYNPLIDEEVRRQWQLPEHWTLKAQLVFGGIAAPAGAKEQQPLEQRLKIFRG